MDAAGVKRGSKAGMIFGLGAAAVLAGCGIYSIVGGMRSESWVSAPGQIVETGGGSDDPREYVYAVGGVTHLGSRSNFGGGFHVRTAAAAQRIIDTAKRGQAVTVWYDPADPADSTLHKGVSRSAFYLILFGLPFAAAGWFSRRAEYPVSRTRLRDLPELIAKADFSRENFARGVERAKAQSRRDQRWQRPSGRIGGALLWLAMAVGLFGAGSIVFGVFHSFGQKPGQGYVSPQTTIVCAGLGIGGAFLFLLLSMAVKRWQVTRSFPKRPARVLGREITFVPGSDKGGSWMANVRCAYEFGGAVRETDVMVSRNGWISKTAADAYLDARVGPASDAEVAVNPADPEEAYLLPLTSPAWLGVGIAAALAVFLAAGWLALGSPSGRHDQRPAVRRVPHHQR